MRQGLLFVVLCGWMVGCDEPGDGVTPDAETQGEVRFDDVSVPDAPDGTGCTSGVRECVGQVVRQCVGGAFQDLITCPTGQVCEAGDCRSGDVVQPETTLDVTETTQPETSQPETTQEVTQPDAETVGPNDPCEFRECGDDGEGGSCGSCDSGELCSAIGRCVATCTPQCTNKECGSDGCGGECGECGGFEQCVAGSCELTEVCDCEGAVCGPDNCGNLCGICTGQTTCSSGRCVSIEAGDTCVEISNACIDACYAGTSTTGVAEFDAYVECLNLCPTPDDNPATTADDLAYSRCSYEQCSAEEAACVLGSSGSGTCFGILDCTDTCVEGDGPCYQECYEQATPAAQTALWGIESCLGVECPDGDELCIEEAINDRCFDFVLACNEN
jgi:hypothetical protein